MDDLSAYSARIKQLETELKVKDRQLEIEAALEKVRSRSLAMHHSDELRDVVGVVFEQLRDLNPVRGTVAIQTFDFNTKNSIFWQGNTLQDVAPKVMLPYDKKMMEADSCHKDLWEAMFAQQALFNKVYTREQKDRWFDYVFTHNDVTVIDENARNFIRQAEIHTVCFIPGNHSALFADSWDGSKFTEEEFEVLKRVAVVFEQAYIRFLYLQKAEAQAKESKIQLALERVRARTMAMHQSSELAETATLLFNQLEQLGAALWTCGFAICDKDKDVVEKWMSSPLGQIIDRPLFFPASHPSEQRLYDAWKNGIELSSKISEGEDLKKDMELVATLPSMKEVFNSIAESGVKAPDWVQEFVVPYRYGYLLIVTTRQFRETDILIRFAHVFEQTYTRFLDLQKAEAQARESQIQLALERVRARTMAMYKSEDLGTVAAELFNELKKFGGHITTGGFVLCDKNRTDDEYWVCWESGVLPPMLVPHTTDPVCINLYKGWESGKEFYAEERSGKELKAHFDYMLSVPTTQPIFEKWLELAGRFPDWQRWHAAYFKYGFVFVITIEPYAEEEIFKRFAPVFEQTYTRFLDLQKAEAQTREAQIEAALEKVRSRSLGMHKSEELLGVAVVLYGELKKLGFQNGTCAIIIMDANSGDFECWGEGAADGYQYLESYRVPFFNHETHLEQLEHWKKGTEYAVITTLGEAKKRMDKYYFFETGFARIPEETKKFMMEQESVVFSMAYMRYGALAWSPMPISDEQSKILQRFSKVFEQSYTRFLDLQKAEAQAREAQIEAALERIRSRAMAMHTSEEINALVGFVFGECIKLGIRPDRIILMTFDKTTNDVRWWMANSEAPDIPMNFLVKHHEYTPALAYLSAWGQREQRWVYVLEGRNKSTWDDYVFTQTELSQLPGFVKEGMRSVKSIFLNASFQNYGGITLSTFEPLREEDFELLARISKVFDLTYTRFLDLKKAEAQAREAQIEAALEKIRSRSLEMHHSNELKEVIKMMFEKLNELQVTLGTVAIWIFDKQTMNSTFWVANNVQQADKINLPYDEQLMKEETNYKDSWEAWLSGKEYINREYSREQKNKYFEYVFANNDLVAIPPPAREYISKREKVIASLIPEKNSALYFDCWTGQAYDEAGINVFRRAGKVFEQAYIRFLDLYNAEAQSKEAQIETALERVRSRSMGMQKSGELSEVIQVVYEQLIHLGIHTEHAGFVMDYKERDDYLIWIADRFGSPSQLIIPYFDAIYYNRFNEAKKSGADFFVTNLSFEEKNEFYEHLFRYIPGFPEESRKDILSQPGFSISTALLENVALYIENFSGTPFTEEANAILMRFGKVFQQAYTRFLDLQKAEIQTREAKIEAALEKVRARSLAMHHSDELKQVAASLFGRLQELGISFDGALIFLFNKEIRNIQLWIATNDLSDPAMIDLPYDEDIKDNEVIRDLWGTIETGKHILNKSFANDVKNEYFRYVQKYNHIKIPESIRQLQLERESWTVSLAAAKNSVLGFDNWSGLAVRDEDFQVIVRFARVFEQAYTRFLDLQKAEKQAFDATKRASVDRVRAEIASMRTTSDLERITPLIWTELTNLGVPFMRCGVFILDEETQQAQIFLYTEGKAIASFTSGFSNSKLIFDALPFWQRNEIYKTHWDEAAFLDQAKNLVEQGAITGTDKYLSEHRPTDLYLHFVPFLQGMLYVGDKTPLADVELQLVQALADAFSTAYARYEDFSKLEAAKKQVDSTLNELQATQKQLIQSEKMASLGELTAGIAHEIQNPLNFVNNFSEVSKELLDEMKDALEGGDIKEAGEIANNIIQNLEKINHHGKRADSIVKGMLQHSRRNTGEKELTDINVLADEYLRLAYHGLRAKDKNFNAILKTDFDSHIEKTDIIPQDIGRVILNLLNNAFYAVSEKKKAHGNGYEPTVSISTRKLNDKIEIKITDNGNGIPENIVDKIFQPFFTTKPTGQGTGLGLSLVYDIIKAHGGDIEVQTKDGEGSNFMILLPST